MAKLINGLVVRTSGSDLLVVKALVQKPLSGSIVDSAFHPSEVDQMSIKDSWGRGG